MTKILIPVFVFISYGSLLFAQHETNTEINFKVNKVQQLFHDLNGVDASNDNEVSLDISQNKKSPGIAMILSLAFPGAGHLYLNRMDAGKYFMAIEAVNIIGLAGVNIYSNSIMDNAKSFSMIHAGVKNRDNDKSFFSNVAYYNSVYDYNNDKLARGEYSLVYDTDKYYWFWDSRTNRNIFEGQRKKSERIGNTEIIFGTAMIVNRITSAISALLLANSQNSGAGVRFDSKVTTNPDNSIDGFVLNLYKNF